MAGKGFQSPMDFVILEPITEVSDVSLCMNPSYNILSFSQWFPSHAFSQKDHLDSLHTGLSRIPYYSQFVVLDV